MTAKQLFDKYYSRLAIEGILKSLFCALIIGFAVDIIVAFTLWYFGANGALWWSIGAFVVVTGGLVPLFYFKKFQPDAKAVAKRLDALGLEERLITMMEFQGDDSYIAVRQREDAQVNLHKVDTKRVRFNFSKAIIVPLCVVAVFGCGMTTVSGLSDAGFIDPGKDVIDNVLPPEPVEYVEVSYIVGEGEGEIPENDFQVIEKGGNCIEVTAVAEDGYAFVEWSDGIKDPVRYDTNVQESMVIEAFFAPIGDGEGDGEGEGEGEGDAGQGDEPGKSNKPSEEEGEPNNGANGAYEENNVVENGEKYYRDLLDTESDYYKAALKWLETAEDVPPELREFIQMYFEILV